MIGCLEEMVTLAESKCRKKFGKPFGFYLLQDGAVIDLEDMGWNTSDIMDGKIVPLRGIDNFTDNSTAPTMQNNGYAGNKKVDNGTYSFQFDVDLNSVCVESQLQLLDGIKTNIIFLDDAGQILAIPTSVEAQKKGFPCRIWVSPAKFPTKDSVSIVSVTVEINNPQTFTKNARIFTGEEQDTPFSFIDDVVPVEGFLLENLRGAAAATTITVDITDGCGTNAAELFEVSDFIYKVDGATVAPSAYSADGKVATFTVAALSAGEVLTLELKSYPDYAKAVTFIVA